MFRSDTACTAVHYLSGEELTAIALLEDGRVLKQISHATLSFTKLLER